MKKILIIIMIICVGTLSGCQFTVKQSEVSLTKVDKEVIDQYNYDLSQYGDSGIYTFENEECMYIVFENMNIDPDKVTLNQEGSVFTIYIEFKDTDNKESRYVYKYINQLDDEDQTLIVNDGKKDYPFDGCFIVD